ALLCRLALWHLAAADLDRGERDQTADVAGEPRSNLYRRRLRNFLPVIPDQSLVVVKCYVGLGAISLATIPAADAAAAIHAHILRRVRPIVGRDRLALVRGAVLEFIFPGASCRDGCRRGIPH